MAESWWTGASRSGVAVNTPNAPVASSAAARCALQSRCSFQCLRRLARRRHGPVQSLPPAGRAVAVGVDERVCVWFVPFLRGEERRSMSTLPVNAVLDRIRGRTDEQPSASTLSCRHPPAHQSVLYLEDRTLLGCEFCGELLLRRPHPMPSRDVPVLEYEVIRDLREQ